MVLDYRKTYVGIQSQGGNFGGRDFGRRHFGNEYFGNNILVTTNLVPNYNLVTCSHLF